MDIISEQCNGFPPHLVSAAKRVNTSCNKLTAHLVAVIVKGGSIISWSSNLPKMNAYTAIMTDNPDCFSIHAEVAAIFKARQKTDLRGCKMFVARITKDNKLTKTQGQIALAMPCKTCMRAIVNYGIKRVIYTIGPNQFGTLNITDFEHLRRNTVAKKLPHN